MMKYVLILTLVKLACLAVVGLVAAQRILLWLTALK